MMATVHVVVRGTLKPDGSLELDSPPNLPAGPVEVVLRSLSSDVHPSPHGLNDRLFVSYGLLAVEVCSHYFS